MSSAPEGNAEPEVTGIRDVPVSGSQAASTGRYAEGRLIVDKYRLVRKLGSGGMGTVWVAHNTVLDVHVAVKLIELTGTDDAEALAQRLLEEARSAARLGHAAIVRVHDFGQTRLGDPFIAMELLDGEDLGHLLSRESRLDPIQAVQLLLPIANALSTAHEKGIIHRDVKPENIFLARDDEVALQPKLLDFGIARMIDRPRKLTVDGLAVGTPDYMSPEQARGEETAAQTDVWAFSVVLYELLTGRCPFDGANYHALLRSIIEEAPRPITEDGIADDALWAILSRGLEKAPVERWSSMRSLGEALALWLQGHGITEDIAGTSLRRAWLKEESVVSPHPGASVRSSVADSVSSGSSPDSVSISVQGMTELEDAEIDALLTPPAGPVEGAVEGAVEEAAEAAEAAEDAIPSSALREAELHAIAELNRGGDPVELLQRSERIRKWSGVVGFLALTLGVVIAVLVGTGILF